VAADNKVDTNTNATQETKQDAPADSTQLDKRRREDLSNLFEKSHTCSDAPKLGQ